VPAKKIDVRCFLEGVQVPFHGATINLTANMASTASVSVMATQKIFNIRPRTHVLLVFWDEAQSGKWRLLWEGQVLGIGFAKGPMSRQVTLMCQDLSNFWDHTYKYVLTLENGAVVNSSYVYFYGNKKATLAMTKSVFNEKIADALKTNDNMPEALRQLFNAMSEATSYFADKYKIFKIANQLQLKDDQGVKKLINAQHFGSLISNMHGSAAGATTLRQLLMEFCNQIYYTISSVGASSYLNGLNSFILKPTLYGTLPPTCNVVLPDICTSVNYNRDFMSEPTRLKMKCGVPFDPFATNDQHGIIYPTYVAPEEVFSKVNDPNKEFDVSSLSDEEKEKGVVPLEYTMPFPDYATLSATAESKADASMHDHCRKMVEYRWQIARYATRTLSVVTEFNPWMVCDFPCLVCDSSASYFASVANISHTISGTEGAYTTFQGNLVHILDPLKDDSPALPNWLNAAYFPDQIDSTYKSLFGCGAMEGNIPGGSKTSSENMSAAEGQKFNLSKHAQKLYIPKDYDGKSTYGKALIAGEGYTLSDSYRRRPIATISNLAQFYGFNGAEKVNDQDIPAQFTGGIFETRKKSVIDEYMSEIRQSRILDGR
jgi:hypothetical protein